MIPEIRTIETACKDGEKPCRVPVSAGVYGFVAVHTEVPPLCDTRRTLTHIATGMAIQKGLERAIAIGIAERIGGQKIWDFRTLEVFEQRKQLLKRSYGAALKEATKPQRKGGR